MSKSKLNVVNPDDVINEYGADSMRLYELFMGPLEATKPWQMDGVKGIAHFLSRTWRLVINEKSGELSSKINNAPMNTEMQLKKTLHKTIRKVLEDTEHMRFNTAISQMMIFVNEATSAETLPRKILEHFLKVLSPYAPHICEELWQRLGHEDLIAEQKWPQHDKKIMCRGYHNDHRSNQWQIACKNRNRKRCR